MSTLTKHLDSLLAQLKNWGMKTPEYLQPGVDGDVVKSALQSVNLVPNDELLELYQWSDGITENGGIPLEDIQFIPGFYLISLNEAIAHLNANEGDERWSPSWFPILANGGGDFYAIDLSKQSTDTCPVINFMIGYPEVDIEYASIESMMRTFDECANAGIVNMIDGRLDMDDAKQAIVAKRLNPSIEFWQEADSPT